MARSSNPQFVPPIEKSLLRRLHTSDTWMIESATENIERFNKILKSIAGEYPWEFISAEAFKQIETTLNSPTELYRHYWHDMLGQIEAFSVMSAWRLAEISRSGVWALRRGDVVCRTLSMNHGTGAVDILRDSTAALSWSTGTFSRSCVVLQDAIRKMLHHLERVRD